MRFAGHLGDPVTGGKRDDRHRQQGCAEKADPETTLTAIRWKMIRAAVERSRTQSSC